ncbi:MAG TPA: hypothetical protein VMB52_01845 [Verrucomicrobiae bacterium]|nr:hypothetical protein [Verrucomicrobiae bacterium]
MNNYSKKSGYIRDVNGAKSLANAIPRVVNAWSTTPWPIDAALSNGVIWHHVLPPSQASDTVDSATQSDQSGSS